MAVTYAFTQDTHGRQAVGNQRVVSGTLTATGTYTTSGDAVSASDFGLGSIESFEINGPFANSTQVLTARYVSSSGKIMHYWPGDDVGNVLKEVSAATDISSFAGHVTVRGR